MNKNRNRDISEETCRIRDHKNRDKRVEAEERQSYRNQLSNETQLSMLDRRLGSGIGAKKERRRLQ